MPLLRIFLAVFYVWLGYWFTYNLSQDEMDAAIVTFAWIHGILKVLFCTLQDRSGGFHALKFVLEIGLCVALCPDIFGWLFTLYLIYYVSSIYLRLDILSLVFTGRTFGQSRHALGETVDRLNRGR